MTETETDRQTNTEKVHQLESEVHKCHHLLCSAHTGRCLFVTKPKGWDSGRGPSFGKWIPALASDLLNGAGDLVGTKWELHLLQNLSGKLTSDKRGCAGGTCLWRKDFSMPLSARQSTLIQHSLLASGSTEHPLSLPFLVTAWKRERKQQNKNASNRKALPWLAYPSWAFWFAWIASYWAKIPALPEGCSFTRNLHRQ